MVARLKANLAQQLEKASSSDLVDVIVELHPPSEITTQESVPVAKSRAEMIAAKKAAFDRSAAGVEEAVKQAGGEITGSAWINQTLRARVPASKLKQLCEHERIAALDSPTQLKPEVG